MHPGIISILYGSINTSLSTLEVSRKEKPEHKAKLQSLIFFLRARNLCVLQNTPHG